MRQRLLLILLAAGAATIPALAEPNYRYIHQPNADLYFGHVSWCQLANDADDPRVLRAEGPQRATVNLPLAPGDTLQTTPGRRCEAQFDTGTLLRLDGQSSLRIETILARSLTSAAKLTNLRLGAGRLHVMYRDYDSREVFQILTPNAALKLSSSAVVDMRLGEDGETVIEVERGQASLLYGPSLEKTRTRKLKAGERASVKSDDTVEFGVQEERARDSFQAWNREMNQRFVELHDGKSKLPKAVERYPRAVIQFAERFADPYGEWLWTELYGYVWRPYLSRDQGWRPFQQGRWVPMSGRQFWVPDEPWGWVPYHLGLWHWDTTHGWMWIPGSAFAPAWVDWGLCDDVSYFRPLTLWDWGFRYAYGSRYRYGSSWYGGGSRYGAGPWYGAGSWYDGCGVFLQPWPTQTTVAQSEPRAPEAPKHARPKPGKEPGPPHRRHPEPPLPPLPKELQSLARKAEVLKQVSEPAALKLLEAAGVSKPAVRDGEETSLAEVVSVEFEQGSRFRDWNSDVRAAYQAGGRIVYSSVTNLVRCDGCSRPLISFDSNSGLMAAKTGINGSNGGSNGGSGSSGSTTDSSGGQAAAGAILGAGGGQQAAGAILGGDRKQD